MDVQFSDSKEHFASLMPVGKGFSPEKMMVRLADGELTYKIDNARSAFQISAKRKGATLEKRTSRAEKQFISKVRFILNHQDFNCFAKPGDVLISLFADSATLFSRNYQAYAVNHEFYRDLRSQHGRTEKEEWQCCRDYALRNVKENAKRKRYGYILDKLEEKAVREDRRIAALEQELILRTDMPIDISLKDIQGYDTKDFKQLFDFKPANRFAYEQHRAIVYGCAPERICAILQEWFPDIELEPNDVGTFPLDILWDFFARTRSMPVEKQVAGHYSSSYREIDVVRCEEYLKWKKKPEDTICRHKSQKPEQAKDIFDKNVTYSVGDEDFGKSANQTERFLNIVKATKRYFGIEGDVEKNVRDIVYHVDEITKYNEGIFPFHYFMVCIVGTKQLFVRYWTVWGEKVLQACDSQCSNLTQTPTQRTERIRFLHSLNCACNLSRDDRARNWNLFLGIYGVQIQSEGECALWQEILYNGVFKKETEEANEDIPAIELTLLCLERFRECLPDNLETLYCYRPGSFLHQGGFAKFLEQYSGVLEACVERVGQRDWAEYKRKYLQEWAKLDCNQAAIRTLCNKRAGMIRWGSISKSLNRELEDFCKSAYFRDAEQAEDLTKSELLMKNNVQELKALLVEAAFRKVLNREATVVLAKQAEKIFNQGTEYKISLTDLL